MGIDKYGEEDRDEALEQVALVLDEIKFHRSNLPLSLTRDGSRAYWFIRSLRYLLPNAVACRSFKLLSTVQQPFDLAKLDCRSTLACVDRRVVCDSCVGGWTCQRFFSLSWFGHVVEWVPAVPTTRLEA